MANRDIRTRFRLEGEAEYRRGMTDAANAIKVLDSEQKLAKAQFEATGDAEQYAAETTRILTEKIKEQEKAVAQAEAAMKELEKNGVSKNDKTMQDWTKRLNDAKTGLVNLEKKLNDTEKSFSNQDDPLNKYKNNIDESKKAISRLDSELKVAESQYKLTGDKQQYASEKARILKEKLEEQEKAVQAAQSAINILTAQGVDPNSEAMQTWKQRLNEAKNELNKTQAELNSIDLDLSETAQEFGETSTAANGFNEELSKVGKDVSFQATITAIDNIKSSLESVIKTAATAAQKVWGLETDAGKWADDLSTAASKAGIDVETYQSWEYASKFIDTQVSEITSSITRLSKDLGSESDEMAKTFNQLGIRTRELNGDVRDTEDVFWDVVDALGNVKDETRRDILAQKLLGSSWKNLNPLIEAGSAAYKAVAEEGRTVATVSEEQVKKLGELNDAQEKMNAVWETAKNEALSGLAPAFTEISEILSNAGQALRDFLNTDEGKAAIQELNDAISGLVKSFIGEDGGKETFEKIIKGVTGAINGFTDALSWLKDNGDLVVGIVAAMGSAWAALTIGEDVLSFLQLLQNVPLDKLKTLFGGGASSVGGAAASAAKKVVSSAAGGGASSLIGSAATTVLPSLLFIGATVEAGRQLDIAYTEKTFGGYNRALEKTDALLETNGEKLSHLQELFKLFSEAVENNDVETLQNAWAEYGKELSELLPQLEKDIYDYMDAYDWIILGAHAAEGLAQGIENEKEQAVNAAKSVAEDTAEEVKKTWDEHSPSRVFEVLGNNAAVGLANGLLGRLRDVQNAARSLADIAIAEVEAGMIEVNNLLSRMSQVATSTPVAARSTSTGSGGASARTTSGGGSSTNAGAAQTINATIVMDKKTVGYLVAPAVNEAIGAAIQAQRG